MVFFRQQADKLKKNLALYDIFCHNSSGMKNRISRRTLQEDCEGIELWRSLFS